MDAAVNQLRADGFDVRDQDVARLSPFVRHHIDMLGRYSFQLPELPGGMRPLRDPDAARGRVTGLLAASHSISTSVLVSGLERVQRLLTSDSFAYPLRPGRHGGLSCPELCAQLTAAPNHRGSRSSRSC